MPLRPHPYAYKTRMSAKRTPYLRPYSPPPLHLIDVVLLCAHRTTIYSGIDRFAFKFAIEDVLADAYDYGIDFDGMESHTLVRGCRKHARRRCGVRVCRVRWFCVRE